MARQRKHREACADIMSKKAGYLKGNTKTNLQHFKQMLKA